MSDVAGEQNRQDVPNDERKQTVTIPRIILAASFLFALLILIDWRYVNEHSERVRFITVNSLSLFVVVIIAIQAVIYRREWRVMQKGLRQTDRMIETMQRQLEAINRQEGHLFTQAEAAKTQAETMQGQLQAIQVQNATLEMSIEMAEKSAIYAQRAYLTATISNIGEEFQFYLRIENNGNTPANDVRVAYAFGMRETPPYTVLDGNEVVYDRGFTDEQRLGLIAPDGHLFVSTPEDRNAFRQPDVWNQWKIGQVRYYIWGRISYEDIFNERRHTDFAFFQGEDRPKGYPCEYGNSAI